MVSKESSAELGMRVRASVRAGGEGGEGGGARYESLGSDWVTPRLMQRLYLLETREED